MSIDTSVGRVEGVRVSIDTSVQVSGQGSAHHPPRHALSVRSSRMVKQGCSPFPCPPLVNSSPPRGGTRWMGTLGGPWDPSGASGGPR